MPHSKQHIVDLAEICEKKGVVNIVISPGSRNAPLINAFYSRFSENCISIVDERSAGYYALGIARFTQLPVVLICTSGTAVLNYAPAIAEAYYQQVPLIVITADRPVEWIDQQDNQTIRQAGIYRNYIKNSYQLQQTLGSDDMNRYSQRLINEALNNCTTLPKGPVHINVPIAEPLYEKLPINSGKPVIIDPILPEISIKLPEDLIMQWHQAKRIWIVHGQDIPNKSLNNSLLKLSKVPGIVIIAENIANVIVGTVIHHPELLLSNQIGNDVEPPELVIYSGGQVVSKKLKSYLRNISNIKNWRIGCDIPIIDTFQHTTHTFSFPAEIVYEALSKLDFKEKDTGFSKTWMDRNSKSLKRRDKILSGTPFSDTKVFENIMNALPKNSVIELGNSSVIRYSQFFDVNQTNIYFSNRGVSGIDGCLSAAAGTAMVSERLTIAIVGDLSFIYDSNALWNRKLPNNLRIIVIDNQGGGMFHLIDGPSTKPEFKHYIEAYHPVNIGKFAEAFGLDYLYADNENNLKKELPFIFAEHSKAIILEVRTDAIVNTKAYHQMMGNKTIAPDAE